MSALKSRSNSLAGLTLDAVLGGQIVIQQYSPPETSIETQTLFDIIREEYALEGHKDRTTWQIFREKLRLKRTGSAWTSSLPIPDIPISNPKHLGRTRVPMSDPPGSTGRGMFTRGSSLRVASTKNPDSLTDVNCSGDGRSFKPQLSRHDSVKDHVDGEASVTFVEERQMSARGAIAAQEAAEAASSDEDEEDDEEGSGEEEENEVLLTSAPKQTMSLMDLLQETDREMGLTGSSYAMDDDEEYEEDEDYEEEEDDDDDDEGGEGDLSCCVCMVKIKGASFSSCGHTFCKLCSKELMAQKGHCPVCSSFILEFLEIF